MKKALTTTTLILAVILAIMSSGCTGNIPTVPVPNPNPPPPPQKFTTYFWCAADKDAYVNSTQDWPHGGLFWDNVGAGMPNGQQRTYMHFYMPILPSGAEIVEAYINVYEDSRQYPGTGSIPIGLANEDWDPGTIIWSIQPNPPGAGSIGASISPFNDVNMWRGSGNVKNTVQQHIDNPTLNFGWVLFESSYYNTVRSFSSVNHLSRTSTDMGQAPRLLLKVETDTQLNLNSVMGANLTPDNELSPRLPGTVLVLEMWSGNTGWPADWEVAVGI
ncbi:DNRLRE domain-containing protein [bacterium]|nr:DNRLRE domain-containing protein [bacterium]